MLALRRASIQCSSQFSYFAISDSLSRLATISKIGKRENYACWLVVGEGTVDV